MSVHPVPPYARQWAAFYSLGVSPTAFAFAFGVPVGRVNNWTRKAYPPAKVSGRPCVVCGEADEPTIDVGGETFCAPCVGVVGWTLAAMADHPRLAVEADTTVEAGPVAYLLAQVRSRHSTPVDERQAVLPFGGES
jgi:hypothetical protein